MTIRIERQLAGEGSVFKVIGALDAGSSRQLERALSGPATDGGSVTLDLSELESCDEAGVKTLASLTRRARNESGELVLKGVPDSVLATFAASEEGALLLIVRESARPGQLFLFRPDETEPFAYASGRRDFSLVSDDSLWAHESHGWLLAAGSGAVLAHRTRGSYFSVETGEELYSEVPHERAGRS